MKKINIPLFQVDAFTNKFFSGNPAAVCLLDDKKDDVWMQSVAMEMNLSETAFVRRLNDGFELRWFTPTDEVDLCGHATLAAGHVLWDQGWLSTDEKAQFHTRSGLLKAVKSGYGITLDFPSNPVVEVKPPSGLLKALGSNVRPVYFNNMAYLVLVDDENILLSLQPDFSVLAGLNVVGVIVTAESDDEKYDFVSRFFAPSYGIDEDPVTGMAHCALAPFWAQRLGKNNMLAYQASNRGGEIRIKLLEDRVLLSGKRLPYLEDNYMLDDACCWMDGRIVLASEAKISVFDHGLLHGNVIFEGVRFYNNKVFR